MKTEPTENLRNVRIPLALVVAMALAWAIDVAVATDRLIPGIRVDYLALGAAFLVAAIFPARITTFMRSRKFLPVICVIGFAAAALALVSIRADSVAGAWISLIFMSVFQALTLLYCFRELSRFDMKTLLVSVAIWIGLAGVIMLVFSVGESYVVRTALNMAIPLLTYVFIFRVYKRPHPEGASKPFGNVDDKPGPDGSGAVGAAGEGAPEETGAEPTGSMPVNLLVVQFVVLVVLKACGAFFAPEFRLMSSLGFIAAAVGVFAFLRASKKLIKLKSLYNMSLLLAEIALVVLALDLASSQLVSGVFNGGAYAVFATFCFTVYGNICLRRHVDPVRLFGLALVCECFASFVGIGMTKAAISAGFPQTTFLLILSALVAIVFLFLFKDSGYNMDWDTRRRSVREDVVDYYYTLPEVCVAVARQYGLSKREETVLQLAAQKKSSPDIAAELYISVPTVKTHLQNIYKKLGVHGRSELFDMLETAGPRDEAKMDDGPATS